MYQYSITLHYSFFDSSFVLFFSSCWYSFRHCTLHSLLTLLFRDPLKVAAAAALQA